MKSVVAGMSKIYANLNLVANDEKHYVNIESQRHSNCVVTPKSVEEYIARGFQNAEPGGSVYNFGHTWGYHGP